MQLDESIHKTIKRLLGIIEDDTAFDAELMLHINSALSTVTQLGVGPQEGFRITSDAETWQDLLGDDLFYDNVKELIFLKTKMVFDPPAVGYLVTAYEKMIEETTWRISAMREDAIYVPSAPQQSLLDDEDVLGQQGDVV